MNDVGYTRSYRAKSLSQGTTMPQRWSITNTSWCSEASWGNKGKTSICTCWSPKSSSFPWTSRKRTMKRKKSDRIINIIKSITQSFASNSRIAAILWSSTCFCNTLTKSRPSSRTPGSTGSALHSKPLKSLCQGRCSCRHLRRWTNARYFAYSISDF